MPDLLSKMRRFLSSEDGQTAIEYALLIGLIAVTLVAVISSLSAQLTVTFGAANSAVGS